MEPIRTVKLNSQVIFKMLVHKCIYKDKSRPSTSITFFSFKHSDERFIALGSVPDYFNEGDKVDLTCIQKYSNGRYEYKIIDMFHQNLEKHYYPLEEFFPSVDVLRKKYQKIDWTYPDIRPFWIIYNDEVYLFSRKNSEHHEDTICLFKPNRSPKYTQIFRCEFYLNRLNK
jgi:hypothetical protein